PGGWIAAERLLAALSPTAGAVLIVPHANRLAAPAFVRTRDEWGDLNRLYPGATDGLPMAQMAWQITETLRHYKVNVVLDMHESWAYFNGRPQNGTAYLGQTVATSSDERAKTLASEAVAAVNARILHPWEELFDRNNPKNPPAQNGGAPTTGGGIPNAGQPVPGGTSSLGLPRSVPGLSVLLVEMGQQQDLERRIALHVEFANEIATRLGII
ncbi:MAG: succinylglutamate desuccinylase/aspartoacylase family protein, partial [Chloroflexi bacterium]|nr:succinylglutamate desuccinylase/aspartoacylase family protein [Chloroflexota bacterium]